MDYEIKHAVYIGRFNPVHAGHEAVIRQMTSEFTADNCLVIIGSCNKEQSLRHFFNYEERRMFIKMLNYTTKVIGLPDYATDSEWSMALDDILEVAGFDRNETIFLGGCEEDINTLKKDGRVTRIMNRFDGTTPKVSATEVRDALIHDKSLEGLVNTSLHSYMKDFFKRKWTQFENK